MDGDKGYLKHSVAFRVNEAEWIKLQAVADANETTVAQLAKEILFKGVGLGAPGRKKRAYGQVTKLDRQAAE